MKENQKTIENAQGADSTKKETNETKTTQGTNAVINVLEKKVQISIKMLIELAGNEKLLKAYIDIIGGEEEIKTPMAYAMAKREINQLKTI